VLRVGWAHIQAHIRHLGRPKTGPLRTRQAEFSNYSARHGVTPSDLHQGVVSGMALKSVLRCRGNLSGRYALARLLSADPNDSRSASCSFGGDEFSLDPNAGLPSVCRSVSSRPVDIPRKRRSPLSIEQLRVAGFRWRDACLFTHREITFS
jgi:hypothetical protein